MRVAGGVALREAPQPANDAATALREIDHRATFPSAEARGTFLDRAIAAGFALRATSEPVAPWESYGARVWRREAVSEDATDEASLLLFDLALEAGGDYEGWEAALA